MTASPISDLNPIFMAAETVATFNMHSRGERNVIMDQFFSQVIGKLRHNQKKF